MSVVSSVRYVIHLNLGTGQLEVVFINVRSSEHTSITYLHLFLYVNLIISNEFMVIVTGRIK